jgi:probable HAF family extracellular repeat protein
VKRLRLVLPVLAIVPVAAVLQHAAPAPAATTTYAITDLGSLGYGVSDGLAINAVGQVTGYSYSSDAFQVSCPPHQYGGQKKCYEHPSRAFLWSNGTMTDLGTLGGHFSRGNSINLSGEVVGTADTTSGSDGFLWNGKKMVDLGAFYPGGINDSGQIAGTCASGACLLSNGSFTQLPNPTGWGCGAIAVNNNGEVLGSCSDNSSNSRAAVWENGTPIDLGTLGGPQAGAAAINNNGQVVGWSQTSTDADHAFIWSNGTMTDLGRNFFPAAINDNGIIVGGQSVYNNGTLQDLNNLIPPGSPYQVQYANAINDNGQIVADAYDTATAQTHALLLTPTG